MANLLPSIKQTFLDADGEPLVGGKLYSYAAGTTTPLATFTDATGGTPNTNPIILDANGQADIWIGQSAYKFVLHNADDVELGVWDGVVLIDAESVTTAKLAPLSVTTAKLADGAVTTIKINNLAITTEKLAASAVTTEKINNGAVITDKIADKSVTPAKLSDAVYSDLFFERNKIINGDMEIWQRGESFDNSYFDAIPVRDRYSADRWRLTKLGAAGYKIDKDTVVVPPYSDTNFTFNSSMKISCTTADATVDAGDLIEISQPIEGTQFRDLIKKEFVFSFWARASKTMKFCVSFKNAVPGALPPGSAATKSYVKEVTIAAANTWQKAIVAVPAPTDGDWKSGTGTCGLSASIVLAAGTSFHTTAEAWQNGNYSGTSTMDNFSDSTSNVLHVTGFRLEGGNIPKQYEARSYAAELAMCLRYYEQVYGLFSGTNRNQGGVVGVYVPFKVEKAKAVPVVMGVDVYTQTLLNTVTATATMGSPTIPSVGVMFKANEYFIEGGTGGAMELVARARVDAEL